MRRSGFDLTAARVLERANRISRMEFASNAVLLFEHGADVFPLPSSSYEPPSRVASECVIVKRRRVRADRNRISKIRVDTRLVSPRRVRPAAE